METTENKLTRPYSQRELAEKREKTFSYFRIGTTKIYHHECGHCYIAKKGGKKEHDFLESNGRERGNCSVCWKLSKTPNYMRRQVQNSVDMYTKYLLNRIDDSGQGRLIADETMLEVDFYNWLYERIR